MISLYNALAVLFLGLTPCLSLDCLTVLPIEVLHCMLELSNLGGEQGTYRVQLRNHCFIL